MFKQIGYKIVFFLAQLFFWCAVYLFYTYFLGYGSENTNYVNQFSLFLMPITICLSYWFNAFLIPKYLLEKHYKLFFLYTTYTLILSFSAIVYSILFSSIYLINDQIKNTTSLTKTLPFIILGVYFIVLISVAIALVWYTYKNELKNEELKLKFTETQLQLKNQELRFLKLQIHPHFLFNTLNTIYGLSLQKADQAPDTILRLSNLLDYILYQVDKPLVLLSEEIKHLKDYITLEEIRFSDSLETQFDISIEDPHFRIPPMLFVPFIENAFKHGGYTKGKLKISMLLIQTSKRVEFTITNPIATSIEGKSGGIGLENIKKRMELLFPNRHKLVILEQNNIFSVQLIIKLKENES